MELERLNLWYIAKWNMALGRYRFLIDENGTTDPQLVHYFGIPRYLLRETVGRALALARHVFNQREFLQSWILLARTIGRMQEIRWAYLNKKICHLEGRVI